MSLLHSPFTAAIGELPETPGITKPPDSPERTRGFLLRMPEQVTFSGM